MSFTAEPGDLADVRRVIGELTGELGGGEPVYADHLAKVSVVGVGMRSHTGVARTMFAALAEAGINIENITTSEIKISCIIPRTDADRALRCRPRRLRPRHRTTVSRPAPHEPCPDGA